MVIQRAQKRTKDFINRRLSFSNYCIVYYFSEVLKKQNDYSSIHSNSERNLIDIQTKT